PEENKNNENNENNEKVKNNKNYIYSRVFTEENKIKEVTTYANGLNQVEQTKTYLPSNNVTVTAQSVTDYSGRPALNTLPMPTQGKSNTYTDGFLTNNGKVYTAENFDNDSKNQADPADEEREMKYYKNNPDARIPDASGFPFTQTTYYDDPLSRVKQEGGPGQMHLIKQDGSGKNVRYYYGVPSKTELIRLFGKEAPDEKTVSKMLKIDPNNIATATYITSDGKVLATCLSFNEKDNLELEPITTGTGSDGRDPLADINVVDEVKDNLKMDWGFVSSKRIIITQTTDLRIDYKVSTIALQQNCAKLNLDCHYTVDILIHDVENNTTKQFLDQALTDHGDYKDIGTITESLKPGTYVIERRLKPGNATIDKPDVTRQLLGQIEPLTKLIGGWLDNVKCKEQVDNFQLKLKGLSDALLNQTLDVYIQQLKTSGEEVPDDIENFLREVYNKPLPADPALPDEPAHYYKEYYTLELLKRNSATNEYEHLTMPFDKADKAYIHSRCCDIPLTVRWIRKFDLNQKPALVDEDGNGKLDVVSVIDADDKGTKYEFIPDFEGYAIGYFDDCEILRVDPDNPNKQGTFYDYMEGWGKPGDGVLKGTFNLMIYHMLSDPYYMQTINPILEKEKNDGKIVTPPLVDYVDDCGNKTGEKGGANTVYTIKTLFECWQNQLEKIRTLNGCDNFVIEDDGESIKVSDGVNKESGKNSFGEKFGGMLKWWMPPWTKAKIKRRIRNIQNYQVNPVKSVKKPHIVKDFLDCAGYQFAKILTPYSPNPLPDDKAPLFNYQVPVDKKPFRFGLNSTSVDDYFKNLKYKKSDLDYYYIPLNNWGPPERDENNNPEKNADGSTKYLFPNIKNPVYAFKYYIYPQEGHKDYQELEFTNNYDDPNDCYQLDADGYVVTPAIGEGIAKGPCCSNDPYNSEFCYPDKNYPNLDVIYDKNDIRYGHDDATGNKWKWIVNDFTGEGRVKARYDHLIWSSGQRYNFYKQMTNFLVDTDPDPEPDSNDRNCAKLEEQRSDWYINTNEFGDTYLATSEENDVSHEPYTQYNTIDNRPSPTPISYVEIEMVNQMNACNDACEKRRSEFRQKILESLAKNCYDVGGCKGGGVGTPYENVVPLEDVDKMVDAMVAMCHNQCKGLNTFVCADKNSRNIQTERTIYGPTETLPQLITGVGGFPTDKTYYDCKKLVPFKDAGDNRADYYDPLYTNGDVNGDNTKEIIKYKINDNSRTPDDQRVTPDMYSWYQYTMMQQAMEWDFELNFPSKCPTVTIEAEKANEKQGVIMTSQGIEGFGVGDYIKFNQ
ncbi:MAG TPA: hypothetical protein VIH57_22090, partial [Bacteroidales bacterium]